MFKFFKSTEVWNTAFAKLKIENQIDTKLYK